MANTANTTQDAKFKDIYAEAVMAGRIAGRNAIPTPMVVGHGEGKSFIPMEVVHDGMCGFAEVKFAGNTAFGRWAKKMGIASDSYPKGLYIWISEYNQSWTRKKAHAEAMARVLYAHGITDAYATNRLD